MSSERIDLYFGMLDAVDTPQAYEACFATLSAAEKQRAEYFVFERHRRQYIFAHGLLRIALSGLVPRVGPVTPKRPARCRLPREARARCSVHSWPAGTLAATTPVSSAPLRIACNAASVVHLLAQSPLVLPPLNLGMCDPTACDQFPNLEPTVNPQQSHQPHH